MAAVANQTLSFCKLSRSLCAKPTPSKAAVFQSGGRKVEVCGARSSFVSPIKAMEASDAAKHSNGAANRSLVDSTGGDCGGVSGISFHSSVHPMLRFVPWIVAFI